MVARKDTTQGYRRRRSPSVQAPSQSSSRMTSCGLMLAKASAIPAGTGRSRHRSRTAMAISPATNKLICCSFNPCMTARLPNVRASAASCAGAESELRKARSQNLTLTAVRSKSIQKNPFCTIAKGSSMVGARRNTT